MGIFKKDHSIEKLPKPVYYVESSDDTSVLVGIDVTINYLNNGKQRAVIKWFDTVKERIMSASEIKIQDNCLVFRRTEEEGGGVYSFMPMNLDIYNNKITYFCFFLLS